MKITKPIPKKDHDKLNKLTNEELEIVENKTNIKCEELMLYISNSDKNEVKLNDTYEIDINKSLLINNDTNEVIYLC